MSSGVPVVAARAGGIPEMIEEGVSGYLFDDEAGAIAAIRQLLPSPEKREAMGKIARIHAAEHSWKAATAILLDHYRAACTTQKIAPSPSPGPTGVRPRLRKALSASTLFAIRKLLP
jgi:hypothetical protein